MVEIAGAAAAEFARARFGGPTRPVERRVTIGTTPTSLLSANPRRVFWLAINLSVNTGFLGFDRAVAVDSGVRLGASGGAASALVEEDGESTAYQVFGINDVASGTWYVLEVERVS